MANSRLRRLCASALFGLLLSTTAVPLVAQTLDELAVRGEVLAAADPRAADLRSRLDEAGRRGFDIGMGGTEGDTLPGPGKQARGEALPVDQQEGYFAAVQFSVTRNANAGAANRGIRIAQSSPSLANARGAEDDGFYALGFDIATGLLYDSGAGPFGELQQGLGAGAVHDTLAGATRRGFEASAQLHGRNYGSAFGKATPITPPGDLGVSDGTTEAGTSGDRVARVPEVTGLRVADAEKFLVDAGYKFTETTVKGSVPRPPFDVVTATVPAAGTVLAHGSVVQYQTIEAAILNGTGRITPEDFRNRIAFDLDTGEYGLFTNNTDIYGTPENDCRVELSKYGGKKVCHDRLLLEANSSARAVILRKKYQSFPQGFNNLLKSRWYFLACVKAFDGEPAKSRIAPGRRVQERYDNGQMSDEEIVTTACVRTAEGHLAVVRFAPEQSIGGHQFEFALFPDYEALKAQGRVKIEPVPGAAPSALSQLSICEKAKWARDRGSPAAPGLTKQCLDSGGTVPQ